MSDEKKIIQAEEKETEVKEINLDELEEVSGGGLRDMKKKKTSAISDEVRRKI